MLRQAPRASAPSALSPGHSVDGDAPHGPDHREAPYADAVARIADAGVLRLSVPGHQGRAHRRPGLAEHLGDRVLDLDVAPLIDGVDSSGGSGAHARARAQELAADAWGARTTWFLTGGATQGNLTTALALRSLGGEVVAQRSVHSSVMDGMAIAGIEPAMVMPSVDVRRGMAHGVVPADLDAALVAHPDAAAAYVVTPSYFGAVSDVAALAEVAHRHGVPLVVDEAWGAHFGFDASVPVNALRLGADLVISSTHKLAGSLGQSAMLHLGHGPWADVLEPLVERALRVTTSTSESSLLLASLDLARRDLIVHGPRWIPDSVADAEEFRARLRHGGRFSVADPALLADPSVVSLDPLRIVVDTAHGGISGHEARRLLFHENGVHAEMSTDSVVVLLVGAGSDLDVDRLAASFAALPSRDDDGFTALPPLPPPGDRVLGLRDATLADSVVMSARDAVGRVSADSLAAYPPGVPNLLPGEIVTAEVVAFLQAAASAPHGYVRGACDPGVRTLRVVR
ncbi:MAG: aminotransferase class I/II-fold pyridoxal phosphate-dependent enzyme [bacterium]